ncbi:MAG: hypothetical protein JETT_2398 [Candidatus Jettenia ecosi]|uniref:Uncharacterized protein n=1 Tax=Candidatus Jettenia ecosi TaxID=2494326 RepID=A0A533Q9G6_9BACT|nr:MAG: hypothetical protein JETT_2398 [Candidatus Jettenia ecosi]
MPNILKEKDSEREKTNFKYVSRTSLRTNRKRLLGFVL